MFTFAHRQIKNDDIALQYRFAAHKREFSLTMVSDYE